MDEQPKPLSLHVRLSPGDELTLTAAVESLHQTYPGEYLTAVDGIVPAIWKHNPNITRFKKRDAPEQIKMQYPAINSSNARPVQFISAYTQFLAAQIGRPLTPVNRPRLYLSEQEQQWISQVQEITGRPTPFWIVNAGVKRDFTNKQWPVEHYQTVIDETRGQIQWVQIGDENHDHEPLRGVIDLRGKTDHRQLIRLCYHASGGLGPVTYLQHLMAAWQKPYICLLGGREPVPWVTYPTQHTLHSIGSLDCCRDSACWKSRTVPLGDGDNKDKDTCKQPVLGGIKPFPRCMGLIQPAEVLAVLRRYSQLSTLNSQRSTNSTK